jgi:superfamily I DNA/RNA helicase
VLHGTSANSGLHEGTRKRLADFVLMIRSFQTMLETQSAYALGEYIARTTGLLQDLFADKTPEGVSRYENIQELLNGMKEFSDPVIPKNPARRSRKWPMATLAHIAGFPDRCGAAHRCGQQATTRTTTTA